MINLIDETNLEETKVFQPFLSPFRVLNSERVKERVKERVALKKKSVAINS